MDRLSSCYFCGAALDASLSEYPVVPKALRSGSDDDTTVVLCPTCRRKLGAIVEPVVDAAGADADPNDDDQSGLMDESGLDPQPDPDAVGDANETADDGGLLDGGRSEPSDDGGLFGGESDGTEAPAGDDAPAEGRDGTTERDRDGGTDRSTDTAADDGGEEEPKLTRLEYNKVMRLLQNRQLPVERDEIRDVATSAYDISPREFDAVIDAAVERDLIGEENGRLVDAE